MSEDAFEKNAVYQVVCMTNGCDFAEGQKKPISYTLMRRVVGRHIHDNPDHREISIQGTCKLPEPVPPKPNCPNCGSDGDALEYKAAGRSWKVTGVDKNGEYTYAPSVDITQYKCKHCYRIFDWQDGVGWYE